jgi:hypothetical protein
MDDGKEEI